MNAITTIAVNEVAGEPRVLDTALGEALGLSRPTNIRQTIEANRAEMESFGLVHASRAPYQSGKGRVEYATAYHLNEEQALLVCLLSQTPKAKAIRAEVIRVFTAYRRGHLQSPNAPISFDLNDRRALRAALLAYDERVEALESEVAAARGRIEEQAPKVEYHDTVANIPEDRDTKTIEDIAKIFGVGKNTFFKWLRDEGILTRSNRPYQKYLGKKWFTVKQKLVWVPHLNDFITDIIVRVTGKGQTALWELYSLPPEENDFLA